MQYWSKKNVQNNIAGKLKTDLQPKDSGKLLTENRKTIIQSINTTPSNEDNLTTLFDALVNELVSDSEGEFLSVLDHIFRTEARGIQHINEWQDRLTTLRAHILPYLVDNKVREKAENLWQQVRVYLVTSSMRTSYLTSPS